MEQLNFNREDYLDNYYVLIVIAINILLQQFLLDKKFNNFLLYTLQLSVQVV